MRYFARFVMQRKTINITCARALFIQAYVMLTFLLAQRLLTIHRQFVFY